MRMVPFIPILIILPGACTLSASRTISPTLSVLPLTVMSTGSVMLASWGRKALKSFPVRVALRSMSNEGTPFTGDVRPISATRRSASKRLLGVVMSRPYNLVSFPLTVRAPFVLASLNPDCSLNVSLRIMTATESESSDFNERLAVRPEISIWSLLKRLSVYPALLLSYLTDPFLTSMELALNAIFLSLRPDRDLRNA